MHETSDIYGNIASIWDEFFYGNFTKHGLLSDYLAYAPNQTKRLCLSIRISLESNSKTALCDDKIYVNCFFHWMIVYLHMQFAWIKRNSYEMCSKLFLPNVNRLNTHLISWQIYQNKYIASAFNWRQFTNYARYIATPWEHYSSSV